MTTARDDDPYREPEYVIEHTAGDSAEAFTMAAARVAAETLIIDNDWTGAAKIMRGAMTMGILNAGVGGSHAIGGYWITPKEER